MKVLHTLRVRVGWHSDEWTAPSPPGMPIERRAVLQMGNRWNALHHHGEDVRVQYAVNPSTGPSSHEVTKSEHPIG